MSYEIEKLAHEVKNPLSICIGYLEMLDHNYNKKYIDIIKDELNRSITILDDYKNNKILDLEELDLVLLFNEIYEIYKIKSKIKITSKEDIYINGDYKKLKQVFINIIKNSIESKKYNTNIYIKINLIETKHNVYITIKDNGIGIKKENISNIFNDFYTTKTYGTGLGLSYSKEIINLHNGTIKYYSKYQKGTKVVIKLPKR